MIDQSSTTERVQQEMAAFERWTDVRSEVLAIVTRLLHEIADWKYRYECARDDREHWMKKSDEQEAMAAEAEVARLRERHAEQDARLSVLAASSAENPACSRCGGPHPFDTSVPSVIWNTVIRARGLQEYLCLTCIVEAFAGFGQSFTANLIGGPFQGGLDIEVMINGQAARDASAIQEENNALRFERREVEERLSVLTQELKEIEEPTCEFCRKSDPDAMHVCCRCWNGANNATWQRRAIAAESTVATLRAALGAVKARLYFVGHPGEPVRAGLLSRTVPDWSREIKIIEAALAPPPVAQEPTK